MDFSFDSIKTYVTENPVKAALIGAAVVGGITLAVSPKAREAVGLGKVKAATTATPRRRSKKRKHAAISLK